MLYSKQRCKCGDGNMWRKAEVGQERIYCLGERCRIKATLKIKNKIHAEKGCTFSYIRRISNKQTKLISYTKKKEEKADYVIKIMNDLVICKVLQGFLTNSLRKVGVSSLLSLLSFSTGFVPSLSSLQSPPKCEFVEEVS